MFDSWSQTIGQSVVGLCTCFDVKAISLNYEKDEIADSMLNNRIANPFVASNLIQNSRRRLLQSSNGFRLEHVISSEQIEGATDAPLHTLTKSFHDTGKAEIRH